MQEGHEVDGVRGESVTCNLLLGGNEGKVDQVPGTNTRTTVPEELEVTTSTVDRDKKVRSENEVQVANAGVHLGAHEEVIDKVARELDIVRVGREVLGLKRKVTN